MRKEETEHVWDVWFSLDENTLCFSSSSRVNQASCPTCVDSAGTCPLYIYNVRPNVHLLSFFVGQIKHPQYRLRESVFIRRIASGVASHVSLMISLLGVYSRISRVPITVPTQNPASTPILLLVLVDESVTLAGS
jgi:hypothetical protein